MQSVEEMRWQRELYHQVDLDDKVISIVSRILEMERFDERCQILLSETAQYAHGDALFNFYTKEFDPKVFEVIHALAEEKFIEATLEEDARGRCITINRITYKGRLELARLERERQVRIDAEKRARQWWRSSIVVFIAGVLFSTIVSAFLPRILNSFMDKCFGEEVIKVQLNHPEGRKE